VWGGVWRGGDGEAEVTAKEKTRWRAVRERVNTRAEEDEGEGDSSAPGPSPGKQQPAVYLLIIETPPLLLLSPSPHGALLCARGRSLEATR